MGPLGAGEHKLTTEGLRAEKKEGDRSSLERACTPALRQTLEAALEEKDELKAEEEGR